MRRTAVVLTVFLLFPVLGGACSHGSNGAQTAGPRQTPPGGSQSLLRDASRAQATPSGSGYVIADPAFKAINGAKALYGTLNGSAYEIEIPLNWNGDLVLYEHGYTGTDPVLLVQPPPIRSHLIQEGFAWAASSYSASGYDPDTGLADSLALLDYFKNSVAVPSHVFIYGTSMGGHIVVSAMERYPTLFDGALSECGAVTGVDEINYVLSYVLVAQYLTGVQLYPVLDVNAFLSAVRTQVLPALGSAGHLTLAGRRFESVIEYLTGGPRPFRQQGFADRLSGNFDLAATENPQAPELAFLAATNATTRYQIDPQLGLDESTLNAEIPRVTGLPSASDPARHPDFAPRTGRLQAPLLTIHTTGDHFVPISEEVDYDRIVGAAGAGQFLVQRAVRRPDHCQFSSAERSSAFDDLVGWVKNGQRPDGDDFSTGDLTNVGLRFTSPLLPGDPGGE